MIIAVIQARMGSHRLPGKVLLDLKGKPVLGHVVHRVSRAKKIDKIVVATTTQPEDNQIEEFCQREGIPVFRGSADDVLDRYYHTVSVLQGQGYAIRFVVRITADCPVIDPEVIDLVVDRMLRGEFDYVSNVILPTYPDGLDVEVFTVDALNNAYRHACLGSDREHVTPFIINSATTKKLNVPYTKDLSSLRWTLDEPRDYKFIKQIYEILYDEKSDFTMTDILHLLAAHPELQKINCTIQRNEGYRLSLEKDNIEQVTRRDGT